MGTQYFTGTSWSATPQAFTIYTGVGTYTAPGENSFTSYEQGYTTGVDRASFRLYEEFELPEIESYGEVQFKVEPSTYYFNNGVYTWYGIYTMVGSIATDGNSSLNDATPTSTELLLSNTPLVNSLYPTSSAITDTNIGSEYIAAQNPATQNADLNLGDLAPVSYTHLTLPTILRV